MSSLVQSVGVQLNRALEELGARPAKAVKPDARSAKGNGKQDGEGLSESSRVHVEEMLKAGMSAVATVVETRIATVETSVVDLSSKHAQLESRVRKAEELLARQSHDVDSLRKALDVHERSCAERFAALEKRQSEQADILDKITLPVPQNNSSSGPGSNSNSQSVANTNPDIPYEQRTVAKIGGFQFDTPDKDMVSFASEKLTEAGVLADAYRHLHCPFTKGSWVLLTFSCPSQLQDARMAFQSKAFVHNDRKIWLDAAKTKAELKPARIIHRAYTALSEQEKEVSEPQQLEKNLKGKQIKMGKLVLAYSLYSELKWTTAAKERYGPENCEILKAWIESE